METRHKVFASVHLFLISEKGILLHLRQNSSFADQYGLIAGHIDGGESATKAIIRESYEEAGITITPESLSMACVSHSNANNNEYVQFFFVCKSWDGEIQNKELLKCKELKFFSLNNLPENIVPYIKTAIENYKQGNIYFETEW